MEMVSKEVGAKGADKEATKRDNKKGAIEKEKNLFGQGLTIENIILELEEMVKSKLNTEEERFKVPELVKAIQAVYMQVGVENWYHVWENEPNIHNARLLEEYHAQGVKFFKVDKMGLVARVKACLEIWLIVCALTVKLYDAKTFLQPLTKTRAKDLGAEMVANYIAFKKAKLGIFPRMWERTIQHESQAAFPFSLAKEATNSHLDLVMSDGEYEVEEVQELVKCIVFTDPTKVLAKENDFLLARKAALTLEIENVEHKLLKTGKILSKRKAQDKNKEMADKLPLLIFQVWGQDGSVASVQAAKKISELKKNGWTIKQIVNALDKTVGFPAGITKEEGKTRLYEAMGQKLGQKRKGSSTETEPKKPRETSPPPVPISNFSGSSSATIQGGILMASPEESPNKSAAGQQDDEVRSVEMVEDSQDKDENGNAAAADAGQKESEESVEIEKNDGNEEKKGEGEPEGKESGEEGENDEDEEEEEINDDEEEEAEEAEEEEVEVTGVKGFTEKDTPINK